MLGNGSLKGIESPPPSFDLLIIISHPTYNYYFLLIFRGDLFKTSKNFIISGLKMFSNGIVKLFKVILLLSNTAD